MDHGVVIGVVWGCEFEDELGVGPDGLVDGCGGEEGLPGSWVSECG